MDIKTHKKANQRLLGKPLLIKAGKRAIVELVTCEEMVVDDQGLIHGGFTFSLADYAAMLAINDPYVVLGSSTVKFNSPVKLGDVVKAEATVNNVDGRRREVSVEVMVEDVTVLNGVMQCFVLSKHVLQK